MGMTNQVKTFVSCITQRVCIYFVFPLTGHIKVTWYQNKCLTFWQAMYGDFMIGKKKIKIIFRGYVCLGKA